MYSVKVKKSAAKFIESDKTYGKVIIEVLSLLKVNPRPYGIFDIKKLKGYRNCYRIRIGKIRIVYQVFEREKLVIVHFIGFREKAYG